MTGNLYDITFDGQSSVVGKRRKGLAPALGTQTAWIGQNPDSGFLGLAPWIMDDPGSGDSTLSLEARRDVLATAGAHLLPGKTPKCLSPTDFGACENGYRESVIHADVELPDGAEVSVDPDLTPRVPTAFGASMAVAGSAGSASNTRGSPDTTVTSTSRGRKPLRGWRMCSWPSATTAVTTLCSVASATTRREPWLSCGRRWV